jgi:hypothetical protein
MRSAAALVAAMVGFSPAAMAAIYTCTDSEGRTVFRDAPCTRGEQREAATRAAPRRDAARDKPAAAPLERKEVERLVARLDKAIAKRDQKAVTSLFSRNAVVEVDLGGGRMTDPMRVDAFGRYLGGAFAKPGYVHHPAPARISISKGKPRATITRTVREAVYVEGGRKEVELRERLTVERDGQRLRISKLRKTLPEDRAASAER